MVTLTLTDREKIDQAIYSCKECYVGMIDTEGFPYVIPMNFGYNENTIYLHSGQEGISKTALTENPNVCITFCSPTSIVWQDEQMACSYRVRAISVLCKGRVEFVEDRENKIEALKILCSQYSEREFNYSEPAIRNVKIWKVEIRELSSRIFGVPYHESHNYE